MRLALRCKVDRPEGQGMKRRFDDDDPSGGALTLVGESWRGAMTLLVGQARGSFPYRRFIGPLEGPGVGPTARPRVTGA